MKKKGVIVQEAQKDSILHIFTPGLQKLQERKEVETVVQNEIWVVKDVLTSQQCQDLINFAEGKKFEDALVNVGNGLGVVNKDFRDCNRVMIDDLQTAELLANILKPYVPLCQEGALYDGMNERFRILKYEKNQKFSMHMDGIWSPKPKIFSVLTVQFYLNTVNKGGSTRFEWEAWKSGEYHCKSEQGKVVIFRQSGWWHEGTHVQDSLKYTVRNDLMYKLYSSDQWEEVNEKEKLICGMCNKNVQGEYLQCGHFFLFCGCCPYYCGDIHIKLNERKERRRCKQCSRCITNPSQALYDIL